MARAEERSVEGPGEGRTVFIPPMCPIGSRFMAGVFRSIGYDAMMLEENAETLALGNKYTAGGECVPCPCTTGALIGAMQKLNMPPEKVLFFMPTACGPCRFGQYAKLDEIIFKRLGWDKIQIMSPSAENAYAGLPDAARMRLFHAIVVADIVRKLGMRVRPYEANPGETDALLDKATSDLEATFGKVDHNAAGILAKLVEDLGKIQKKNEKRHLVGIVGEIFVRSDPFINMNLYRRIEQLGGEAWLAPIHEWILYTNELARLVAAERGGWAGIKQRIVGWFESHFFFHKVEELYYGIADPLLHDRREPSMVDTLEAGTKYLPWQFEGESVLTLGRTVLFKHRDNCRAVVNASPMFCMPGTITTSIFPQLERELGIPIICNFYDGSGDPNQSLVPCMHYLREDALASAK